MIIYAEKFGYVQRLTTSGRRKTSGIITSRRYDDCAVILFDPHRKKVIYFPYGRYSKALSEFTQFFDTLSDDDKAVALFHINEIQ